MQPSSLARSGRLGCVCPEDAAAQPRAIPDLALYGGFGLVTLAQALTLGALPLAGAMIAPDPAFAGWPTAAFLFGAFCASLPAGLLLDTFGRRAALALGAGLGVAGGLAAAHAVYGRIFPLLIVGAAWLGAAQGFGMFYRHVAAFGAGRGRSVQAVGRVLGAGALAGLASPLVAGTAEQLFSPYLLVGTLAAASLAQLGALVFATGLPEARVAIMEEDAEASGPMTWRGFAATTLIGALAWAAMASATVSAPLGLAACGVAVAGISGVVAWHVVAMYAPALLASPLARRLGVAPLAAGSLLATVLAAAVARMAGDATSITAALLAVGAGWSLTTAATTAWLHEAGALTRPRLAAHDALLLAGAVAGALLGGA